MTMKCRWDSPAVSTTLVFLDRVDVQIVGWFRADARGLRVETALAPSNHVPAQQQEFEGYAPAQTVSPASYPHAHAAAAKRTMTS